MQRLSCSVNPAEVEGQTQTRARLIIEAPTYFDTFSGGLLARNELLGFWLGFCCYKTSAKAIKTPAKYVFYSKD